MRDLLGSAFVGVTFGFALSRIGFSSWDEVHAMFTFSSWRMFFAFACAVVLLGIAWPIITRMQPRDAQWPARPIHKGTLAGGILFGAGWALSGSCPSIALVQIGEGQLAALWTLGGIFLGNFVYAKVHEAYFTWTMGSCLDE